MTENEAVATEARPEIHSQKPMRGRGILRLVLAGLLVFGLGALLIAFGFYLPARQMLDKANADLDQASTTITSNTAQITTLQTGSAALQKNLDSATLHMTVLKALSGVRGASLAIAAGDYAGARLSLTEASAALDSLSGLLQADQKDVFSALQQSAAKALIDMKADLKSAQPELDQLTKNLAQLEKNMFTTP
jgi:cell division protein FtsB